MIETVNVGRDKLNCLTKKCIIHLHELLSNNVHLLDEMDPVYPPGIKDHSMLESAIGRQTTGFGNYLKYPDYSANAATLMYGVIKNHSFHNGNKRAGLLCLIKHLYANGYVLNPNLKASELYELMIAIADSKIQDFAYKHKKKYSLIRSRKEKKEEKSWEIDTQIKFLGLWIKKNSFPKSTTIKGEVKLSHLRKVLINKRIEMNVQGAQLEVFIRKENKFLGLGIGTRIQNKKSYSLGGNRSTIGKGTLKVLRRDFKLTKADGIDDTFFYDDDAFLDSEIKTYKSIIYRLSKT